MSCVNHPWQVVTSNVVLVTRIGAALWLADKDAGGIRLRGVSAKEGFT